VTAVGESSRRDLRSLLGRSGDLAVFGPGLLQVLRWAAVHYVAPLAALLNKAGPPNLPRRPAKPAVLTPVGAVGESPLPHVSDNASAGRKSRAVVWVGPGPWSAPIAAVAAPVVAAGRSALVVVPTVAEAESVVAELGAAFGSRVVAASSWRDAAAATRSWVAAAQQGGHVVVGTREAAYWPIADLGIAFVVGDGRRALKDKATPTTHARDVLWRRAAVERFGLVVCGLVPSGEALARGPDVVVAAKPWGLVEIVDRTEDPPGGRGVLAERTRAALRSVVGRGGRAFLFAHRRAPALRCVRCRTLRTCRACGAHPGREEVCPRCGGALGGCPTCDGARFEPLGADVARVAGEAARVVGADLVGIGESPARVVVGSERDLPTLGPVDLGVVVDADGLLRDPTYRAAEDGLRLMARVAAASGRGGGRRAIVQTADPGHPALEALRRADPVAFVHSDMRGRAELGFPPGGGEMLVVEVVDAPVDADAVLRAALGDRAEVHGPAHHDGRRRWLVQGADLRPAKIALRPVVQELRDRGGRVRIDADPIDL
jgi:primosomal protein N' (replication factor Y)